MALKNKYAKAEEIPAELKSFYVERDGAWLLDSERNEELRQTNITVMKERDALLKRFEGIDPDAVRQLADEKRKLEEAAQLKAGEFEKVLAARLKDFQDKNLTPMQARAEAAEKRLAVVMIDDAVRDAALKRGVIPSALPDGAAQKDTARELSAKLASLKGIVWVGVAVFLFGLATMFYPPLKLIISSVTTSAAITVGGLALIVLPTVIVGNEMLIMGGVAAAVGLWFLAHRHGQLRGLVDSKNSETKGDA